MTTEQLRAIVAAATPGPWTTRGCSHGGLILERPAAYPVQTVPAEDAASIAALRNHAEALLDVVEASKAARMMNTQEAIDRLDAAIARLEAVK